MAQQIEIDYVQIGDYQYPEMTTGYEEPTITRYGMMHRDYMMENNPELVEKLDNEWRLMFHLAQVEKEAEKLHKKILERKVREAIATGEITEELRNEQPLVWASIMERLEQETISQVAREYVLTDIPVTVEKDPTRLPKSALVELPLK
ncbi:MAG: TnpV protein [Lachnospiraceae bacterium]|nr:TnpV protein [Lachnospiraceae bacterium]